MRKPIIKDEHYLFTGYMHLAKDGGMRLTKTASGSYSHERMCKFCIQVPVGVFRDPEFEVNILFRGEENTEPRVTEILREIDEALSDLPIVVNVITPEPK